MISRKMASRKTASSVKLPGSGLLSLLLCLVVSAAAQAGESTEDTALATPKANFATADANADGGLDKREFRVFVDANAEANFGKSKKIRRFKAYDRVFKKVDTNKDAQISWQEFADAQ